MTKAEGEIDGGRPDQAAVYFARALRSAPDSLAATNWVSDLLLQRLSGAPRQLKDYAYFEAFSPDWRRVVTTSENAAQVWEADTGKPVGAPLQHQYAVYSAAFSPDGRRVVTASSDHTARVWAVVLDCCALQEEAERLASLAEAVGGYEVSDTGALTPIDGRERLRKLVQQSGTVPAPELSLEWIIRRFTERK
jgi:hypothetical protein